MKHAFSLAWETPAGWAEKVAREPRALLCDHAHCELGAASFAQSLVARYPRDAELVDRMSGLAIEELRHFRQAVDELHAIGGELTPPVANPYVRELELRAQSDREEPLLDRLLVAGLIERRSHERFALLADCEGDADPGAIPARLRELYSALLESEAAHARLFYRLACGRFAEDAVDERLAVLCEREGDLAKSLPFAPRMHSGLAGSGLVE